MSECLRWWGSISAEGYGTASVHSRNVKAHRLIFAECFGPIPPGHDIHHECGNPACVNPEHLRAVTRAEHVAVHESLPKAWEARRVAAAARTHCKHGHEWSAENTRISRGQRNCRACAAEATRRYKRRLREGAPSRARA